MCYRRNTSLYTYQDGNKTKQNKNKSRRSLEPKWHDAEFSANSQTILSAHAKSDETVSFAGLAPQYVRRSHNNSPGGGDESVACPMHAHQSARAPRDDWPFLFQAVGQTQADGAARFLLLDVSRFSTRSNVLTKSENQSLI